MSGHGRGLLRVAIALTWMSLAAYLVTSHAVRALLAEMAHIAGRLAP